MASALPTSLKKKSGQGNDLNIDDFLSLLPSFGKARAPDPDQGDDAGTASRRLSRSNSMRSGAGSPVRKTPSGCITYTVQANDTLRGVAVRFGMAPGEVLLLNKLSGSYVYPGQTLFVKDPESQEAVNYIPATAPDKRVSPRSSTADYVQSRLRQPSMSRVARRFAGPKIDPTLVSITPMPQNYLADLTLTPIEYFREDAVRLHCMYFTDGEGIIAGTLSMDTHLVTFLPDVSDLVRELGAQRFSFQLSMYSPLFRGEALRTRISSAYSPVSLRTTALAYPNGSLRHMATSHVSLDTEDLLLPRSQTAAPEFRPHHLDPAGRHHAHLQEDLRRTIRLLGEDSPYVIQAKATLGDPETDGGNLTEDEPDDSEDGQDTEDTANPDEALARLDAAQEKHEQAMTAAANVSLTAVSDQTEVASVVTPSKADSTSDSLATPATPASALEASAEQALPEPAPHGDAAASAEATASGGDAATAASASATAEAIVEAAASGQDTETSAVAGETAKAANVTAMLKTPAARPTRRRLRSNEDEDYPLYICLRQQLVFGEPPTAGTVAQYWLGVSRGRLEPAFQYLEHTTKVAVAHNNSWEVVEHEEMAPTEQQRLNMMLSVPKIKSKFLTPDMVEAVAQHLPSWQRLLDWKMIYSTYRDGISLGTLYKNADQHPGASLLFVRDTAGHIFGAYTPDTWHPSENKFYGSGKAFVFKLKPTIEMYKWTGANRYIMMGAHDNIVVGGGGGTFAIWIDGDFNRGSSQTCTAFNNPPLASGEQFEVHDVEVWAFNSM
ncbi:uncharacterized protein MONBRDRAFT_38712 [Monosiga brevicollis MX1]|uniref:Oxidation resistance protein 1 n=1 Tax=Monosiga brevicollis TaxID=81824 RepID=A9V9N7_MONBE|nr:uncharacterized protein MONBRDRAFT_38712 [Monosiga brevicollis MX1]EDQ85701.1 predicted protein [Monosiga brevicollis MX1]|eukprot:XP_001749416.1 hypothetical protein [Monosiga brevicollis MX1]